MNKPIANTTHHLRIFFLHELSTYNPVCSRARSDAPRHLGGLDKANCVSY